MFEIQLGQLGQSMDFILYLCYTLGIDTLEEQVLLSPSVIKNSTSQKYQAKLQGSFPHTHGSAAIN